MPDRTNSIDVPDGDDPAASRPVQGKPGEALSPNSPPAQNSATGASANEMTTECRALFAEFAASGSQPVAGRPGGRRAIILIAILILLAGLTAWLVSPPGLTPADASRIRLGMTLEDAERALGYRADGVSPPGKMPDASAIRGVSHGADPAGGQYYWDVEGGRIRASSSWSDGRIDHVWVEHNPGTKPRSRLVRWLGR